MTDIVALQLYTVRDETAKDYKQTIRNVAEIGYAGVEFAGYGNLSSVEMSALLKETGLKAAGTHVGLAALEQDFDAQANYCVEIGCDLLIIPSIPQEMRTLEGVKKLMPQFNEYGRRARERGLTLAYHNHNFEFEIKENDVPLEEIIASNTDPDYVKFELDTYWAIFGGADPVTFMQKHAGRIASLHLKDMTPDRQFTEIGAGTLNIADFIEAGQAAGATVFIVENDKPSIPSLESARRSFASLHRSLT